MIDCPQFWKRAFERPNTPIPSPITPPLQDAVSLPVGPRPVVVGPGDTLSKLGAEHGFDWEQAQIRRNGEVYDIGTQGIRPEQIRPGDEIITATPPPCCGDGETATVDTATDAIAADDSGDSVEAVSRPCELARVIVIDPGHGGTQNLPGSSANNATSASGTLEKNLALKFAKVLKTEIERQSIQDKAERLGYCEVTAELTRDSDVNIGPSVRRGVAASNKADILCSIHFNGFNGSARGTETFYRNASGGAQSNEADDRALAGLVNQRLYDAIKGLDSGARNRGVKHDRQGVHKGLSILRDPGVGLSGKMCKSILIEVEFIDNPDVDRLLVSGPSADANIQVCMAAVAEALVEGLQ